MAQKKPLHPDFLPLLELKETTLIALFNDLRIFILDSYPTCNELFYSTHALTTVFSISEKLADAFCMIPIYTNHLNFGFNKGTLLPDPHHLLQGSGNLIRHIPVTKPGDYRNKPTKDLLKAAVQQALKEMDKPTTFTGAGISKIKTK